MPLFSTNPKEVALFGISFFIFDQWERKNVPIVGIGHLGQEI
jgi:hypothetical protein